MKAQFSRHVRRFFVFFQGLPDRFYSATRLTVATQQSLLQIMRQSGCENFTDSHACLRSSHGYNLTPLRGLLSWRIYT